MLIKLNFNKYISNKIFFLFHCITLLSIPWIYLLFIFIQIFKKKYYANIYDKSYIKT